MYTQEDYDSRNIWNQYNNITNCVFESCPRCWRPYPVDLKDTMNVVTKGPCCVCEDREYPTQQQRLDAHGLGHLAFKPTPYLRRGD